MTNPHLCEYSHHDRQIITSAGHHIGQLADTPVTRTAAFGIATVLKAMADAIGDVTMEQLSFYSDMDQFSPSFDAATHAAICDALEILSVFCDLSEAQLRGLAAHFKTYYAETTGNFWLDQR